MRAFVLGFILGVWPAALTGCAAADYTGALQNCVDTHIGDPAGREKCLCDVSADAGRDCQRYLDGGVE